MPKIGAVPRRPTHLANEAMSKRPEVTCNDCYFRRAALCALPTDAPCPTFRLAIRGELAPPKQPALVPLPAFVQPAAA